MGGCGSKTGGAAPSVSPPQLRADDPSDPAPALSSSSSSSSSSRALTSPRRSGGDATPRVVAGYGAAATAAAAAVAAAKKKSAAANSRGYTFKAIADTYETFDDLTDGLRAAGLESSNLVLAIDYTKSNQWTGKTTFGGRCLHYMDPPVPAGAQRSAAAGGAEPIVNPYMLVIEAMGKTIEPFDDDKLIPCFGFGDATTKDRGVFPFFPDSRPARGFAEALERYKELTPTVVMAGPTNFAPAIEAALQYVKDTKSYHILVIIADGQVTNREHTEAAIVRASEYPLSIIVVGVGDGPWDTMDEFDDALPARKFDNFQFVNFTKVALENPHDLQLSFAIAAFQEIPEQYLAIRKLGLV